jgi:hypothetical protein
MKLFLFVAGFVFNSFVWAQIPVSFVPQSTVKVQVSADGHVTYDEGELRFKLKSVHTRSSPMFPSATMTVDSIQVSVFGAASGLALGKSNPFPVQGVVITGDAEARWQDIELRVPVGALDEDVSVWIQLNEKGAFVPAQSLRMSLALLAPGRLGEHIQVSDSDDPKSEGVVAAIVFAEILGANYERVDKTLAYYASTKERLESGRWKLAVVVAGIEQAANRVNRDIGLGIAVGWKFKSPRSVAVAFYEAEIWAKYAWVARGSGYSSTVTSEGWRLFRERLNKAMAVLENVDSNAKTNPAWYATYLHRALELDWPLQDRLRIFREAIQQEPYYHQTYFAMLRGLTPKWGGNYEQIAQFAEDAVKETRAQEGESMYARVYWYVSANVELQEDLFKDVGASWPRMRKGFEELQARYPKSYWLTNNFASFACRARDKATFFKLLPIVEKKVYPGAWRTNYSYDLCKHMFTEVT